MAVKLFLDNILLLEVYSFKGFSNLHKKLWNGEQLFKYVAAVTSSDFIKSSNIAKDC